MPRCCCIAGRRKRPRRSTVETLARVVAAHEERWPALTTETHRDAMRAAFAATRVVGKESEARGGKEAAGFVATKKENDEAVDVKVVNVVDATKSSGAAEARGSDDADASALSAALSG